LRFNDTGADVAVSRRFDSGRFRLRESEELRKLVEQLRELRREADQED
jgi:hypothetical protein